MARSLLRRAAVVGAAAALAVGAFAGTASASSPAGLRLPPGFNGERLLVNGAQAGAPVQVELNTAINILDVTMPANNGPLDGLAGCTKRENVKLQLLDGINNVVASYIFVDACVEEEEWAATGGEVIYRLFYGAILVEQ
jgi:hypothetical protein